MEGDALSRTIAMVDRVSDRKEVATLESAAAPLMAGTAHDRKDMARIGKEQELLVRTST
ncbi:MAG: hypothetical protein LQ344_004079 [Seirophora lacunosa]|nr:MAG: hypothetical protein LQ344_004079 [Seirophora lacunosa]